VLSSPFGELDESADPSWLDYFAVQLGSIIGHFDLRDQRDQILRAFALICKESLGTQANSPPPNFSRINFDGIPLQYSLALGAFEPALQFIGEAGGADSSNSARLELSKERISSLLELLRIDGPSFRLSELLDEMAPAGDPDLLSDHAGSLWLSPSFSARQAAKLTVYINAKWGPDKKRIDRLDRFASYLGADLHWEKFETLANSEAGPLGAAVTLSGDSRPTGRIYLSTYGRPVDYFVSLARAMTKSSFAKLFESFATIILGEDCQYPTRSGVCSVGLGTDGEPALKFELCGHCAFENDVQAKSRCLEWLTLMKVDPTPYLRLLATLSENHLSPASSVLHAYVGVGLKRNQPYTTIYLKPNPIHRG
jgi:hypothetical protein